MIFNCVLLFSLVPGVCLSLAVYETYKSSKTKEKVSNENETTKFWSDDDSFGTLGDSSINSSDSVPPRSLVTPEDLPWDSSIVHGTKAERVPHVNTEDVGKTTTTQFLKEEAAYKEREMNDTIQTRSFLTKKFRHWGNNYLRKVEIPYVFDDVDDIISQKLFPRFVQYFTEHTCIRWVPKRFYHSKHVKIVSGKSGRCYASLGAGHSSYEMHLSASCAEQSESSVPHEMMHILGFIHEHQRRDRDCYITVSARELFTDPDNMEVYTYEPSDTSFPYDPNSVMQYPSYGIMTWKDDPRRPLGPVNSTLSKMDLIKINYVYCNKPHWCYWYDCKAHEQRLANCYWQRNL